MFCLHSSRARRWPTRDVARSTKKRFVWRTRLDPADIEVIEPAWEVETSWVQSDQIVTLDVEEGRFLRHVGTVRSPRKLGAVTRSIYEMFRP